MPLQQIRGTISNAAGVVRSTSLSDLLPPSILSTLVFIRNSIPRSLGFTSSIRRQLTGVIVVAVVMVVSSVGALTVVAVPFVLLFGPLALLRFIPAVNRRWPISESDWPLWEVR